MAKVDAADVLLSRSKVYQTVDGTEITIKPFVMRVYFGTFRAILDMLARTVKENPGVDLEKLKPEDIPKLLEVLPETFGILEKMLDVPKGTFDDHCDIGDTVNILQTILDVNRVEDVIKNFKTVKEIVMRQYRTQPPLPASLIKS